MAGAEAAFRVDLGKAEGITIAASESAAHAAAERSLSTMMQEPVKRPCPVPDSFISTFIRPIRC